MARDSQRQRGQASSFGALAGASIGHRRLWCFLMSARLRRSVRGLARTRRRNAQRRLSAPRTPAEPSQAQPQRGQARGEEQPRRERENIASCHPRHLPSLGQALPVLDLPMPERPALDQQPVHRAAVSVRWDADGDEMEMTAERAGVTVAG